MADLSTEVCWRRAAMYQVSVEAVTSWEVDGNFRVPYSVDMECPNRDCRRSLASLQLKWTNHSSHSVSQAHCAKCKAKVRLFMLSPPKRDESIEEVTVELYFHPSPSFYPSGWERVAKSFPRFISIYGQATEAEGRGLHELSGVGYRKALEFLIKDYLTQKHPQDAEVIATIFLGKCIENYIDDDRIRVPASRAAWLGNDHAHYIQKWEDPERELLKRLLELVVYWVSAELESKQLLEDMPEPK